MQEDAKAQGPSIPKSEFHASLFSAKGGQGKLVLKEKNHRFNGRYEELTGDIKRSCAEVDDEERCNRALFWEYSTKQPLFECKWQDAAGDLKFACRQKSAEASAPKECTMCKLLGHPTAEPAAAAPPLAALPPDHAQKLLDQKLLDQAP